MVDFHRPGHIFGDKLLGGSAALHRKSVKIEIIGKHNFARLVVNHQSFFSSDFYHTYTVIIKILHYPIYSPCDYNINLYDSLC